MGEANRPPRTESRIDFWGHETKKFVLQRNSLLRYHHRKGPAAFAELDANHRDGVARITSRQGWVRLSTPWKGPWETFRV